MAEKFFLEGKKYVDSMNYLEKLSREGSGASLYGFCDVLLEISVKDDSYKSFAFSDAAAAFFKNKTGSYTELLKLFSEKYFGPEERKDVIGKLMLSSLIHDSEKSEDKKAISQHYAARTQTWIATCAHCTERESGKYVILMASDITNEKRRDILFRNCMNDAFRSMDAAGRIRSEFVEKVGRDFRKPAENISSLLGMARENISSPVVLEDCLNKMEESSDYMLALLRDMRDISSLEIGSTVLVRESFDMAGLMDNLSRRIRKQAGEKHLTFNFSEKGKICRDYYMIGDAKRLCQALENMLINAVKYTPEGGSIDFSYGETKEDADRINMEFTIKDSGIGIEQEDINYIFEPFWRKDEKEQSGYDAKGLSLTISLRLVQLMNGSIDVKSVKNEGSCFTVNVVLEKGMMIGSREDKKAETEGEKCIMVADASLLDAEMVVTFLEMQDFNTEKSARGADVIEKFKNAPKGYYQALILDESMPIKSGSNIAREIRSIEKGNPGKYGYFPVPIIITAKNPVSNEQELIDSKIINAVIKKPVASEKLSKALNDIKIKTY